MRILVISSRTLHIEDSGGSRTIISRMNYLLQQPAIEVYITSEISYGADQRIIQCPVPSMDVQLIRQVIIDNDIDIVDVSSSAMHIDIINQAVAGLDCKVIAESHISPGFEIGNLRSMIRINAKTSTFSLMKAIVKEAFFPLYKYYIYRKKRSVFQHSSLYASKLVVLAESFIAEYKKAYHLPNATNIVAIGNPLSFDSSISVEQMELKEKTILIVSRLDETHKRISIAIKAWKQIEAKYPQWNMKIVGSGDSEQTYRRLIDKLGLKNIELSGQQSPEHYYEKASIFLMTSAYEGWGMTITEALQKGCVPVVMNSFSALSSIVSDSVDGFITPNNDLPAFIEKIELLINHPELRRQMAIKGMSSCQRFSIDTIGQQWIKLYNEVLNS